MSTRHSQAIVNASARPTRFPPTSIDLKARKNVLALAAAVLFAFAPLRVFAQESSSASLPAHRVALIDVRYIFKNLPAIKSHISKVEASLKEREAELKQQQNELRESVERLKAFRPGTAEYLAQEEKVAQLDSEYRLAIGRAQHSVGDAEAKLYYDNYLRIVSAVKAIASHNNINLVLRLDGEAMDLENRESIARSVAKNVVYYDETIDMTQAVMQYLEQRTKESDNSIGAKPATTKSR